MSTIVAEDLGVEEGLVFNRVIRWTPDGLEFEHDKRHADVIIQEMGSTRTGGDREGEWSQLLDAKQAFRF